MATKHLPWAQYQDSRQAKNKEILEIFDALREWPGIGQIAKRCGVSRQRVSQVLTEFRPEQYRKRRHPTKGAYRK